VVARRTWRMSAFVEESLGARVYALARTSGCSVTAIVEAALAEYLGARPVGTALPLTPRLPRTAGRPSRLEELASTQREQRMRKRTGRPLRASSRTT